MFFHLILLSLVLCLAILYLVSYRMFLFITTLLHAYSVCKSPCLETSFSSWARHWNPFSLPDGSVILHCLQDEAIFHLTPPSWLKFHFKSVLAKLSLCSKVVSNSSSRPLLGTHSCSLDLQHCEYENWEGREPVQWGFFHISLH